MPGGRCGDFAVHPPEIFPCHDGRLGVEVESLGFRSFQQVISGVDVHVRQVGDHV